MKKPILRKLLCVIVNSEGKEEYLIFKQEAEDPLDEYYAMEKSDVSDVSVKPPEKRFTTAGAAAYYATELLNK